MLVRHGSYELGSRRGSGVDRRLRGREEDRPFRAPHRDHGPRHAQERQVSSGPRDQVRGDHARGGDESGGGDDSSSPPRGASVQRPHDPLYVDCANGAGQLVLPGLQRVCGDLLKLEGFNMARENLNNLAGANYLYTQRAIPSGFTAETARGKRLCSLDGDADRLLYWRVDEKGGLDIMDGDKEMSLAALWVRKQVDELGLADVTIGAVKTAYANGASTVYAKENGIPVAMAKTGVKYLHPLAAANDVGTYFEANGHGTVLFKKSFVQRLRELDANKLSETQEAARERLLWASVLVNQAVGDALSDALFLEAVMITMDISLEQFSHLYENLPW